MAPPTRARDSTSRRDPLSPTGSDPVGSGPAPGGSGAPTPVGQLISQRLVGREAELQALVLAMVHPPALVRVEGEFGVGKTRLVKEALGAPELANRPRLIGHCQPLREPFPLGPVMEALREAAPYLHASPNPVVGALRPFLPELADILPAAPEPLGDARAERHRVFRAVAELLAELGPAVLILEDLHWADEETLDLLRFLLIRGTPGLAIVVTLRTEELSLDSPLVGLSGRNPVADVRLALRPLDADRVGELAREILNAEEISPQFAGYLRERTGGVPFAVEEVLRLLQERRDIVRRGGRWTRRTLEQLEVPAALRDWILERMARLGERARAVLRAASVLEAAVSADLVAAVAGMSEEDVAAGLAEASEAALLQTEKGAPTFRHALARQSVYESIPDPERQRLHLLTARALEAQDPERFVAALAHHYGRAGSIRQSVAYAERAADVAASLGDDATASRFLLEALAAPDVPTATRGRMGLKLGRAALQGFAHRDSISVIREIVGEDDLPTGMRGELRWALGQLIGQEGDSGAGRVEVKRAVAELRRRPAVLSRAMTSLAWLWVTEGTVEEHLKWLRRAVRTVERSSDREAKVGVFGDQAAILTSLADPKAEKAVADLPIEGASVAERRHVQRAWANISQAFLWTGHYRRARDFLEKAVRMSEELSYMRDSGVLEATEVLLDFFVGDWDGLWGRARRLSEATLDVPHASVDVQLVAALLDLSRGRLDEAEAALSEVAGSARAAGSLQIVAAAFGALGRMRLAAGDVEESVRDTDRGIDVLRRKGLWVWSTEVVMTATDALLAAGRGTEAEDLVNQLERGLRRRDAPAPKSALAVCRAGLREAAGDNRAAARSAARAARSWDALPRPYEAALARERWGRNLLAVGAARGGEVLREALSGLERLGASWDAARLRRTLRNHGLTAPHRRGRKGYGDRLSPREEEVARLVIEGRTYREIGAALFLSPRTVEHHAENAVRKLGVPSREELFLPERSDSSR